MPRELRVEYAGAIYHVLNRGDRREPIFVDAADCQRFLETLAGILEGTRKTAGLVAGGAGAGGMACEGG